MCFVYVCHMCVYFSNACSLVCTPEVGSGCALCIDGQCFAGPCPPLGLFFEPALTVKTRPKPFPWSKCYHVGYDYRVFCCATLTNSTLRTLQIGLQLQHTCKLWIDLHMNVTQKALGKVTRDEILYLNSLWTKFTFSMCNVLVYKYVWCETKLQWDCFFYCIGMITYTVSREHMKALCVEMGCLMETRTGLVWRAQRRSQP